MTPTIIAYALRHTAQGHALLDRVCGDLTGLLHHTGSIKHYSQRIDTLHITFDILPPARFAERVATQVECIRANLHVTFPIVHPHFLSFDEDELRQYLAELVLEAILIAEQHDGTLCVQELYHSLKFHLYRKGWFTRLIFPAA